MAVVKVYDTEANALANGVAGRLDHLEHGYGLLGIANSEAATAGANLAGPFYIYNKYFYRFESNEPVSEFHIDWDEGEDNSPEKASIEIIKLDSPAFSTVTSHIFTEHKIFFPLVRVKSIDGFLSKWYTNAATTGFTTGRLLPLEDIGGTSGIGIGQNEFSLLSLEGYTNATARIPYIVPSNMPPVGVLKADRKRIYSNIDNDNILSTFTYPLFYASSETAVTSANKPDIKFTFQDSNGAILEETLDGTKILSSTTAQND